MTAVADLAARARSGAHRVVLVADDGLPAARVAARFNDLGLGSAMIVGTGGIRPSDDARLSALATRLRERWPERVRDDIHALDLAVHPILFAVGLLLMGEADVLLAGPSFPPDQVEEAYRWILGRDRAARGRASVRYLATADDRLVTTLTPDTAGPLDARSLAQVALAAANHRRRAVGDQPRVAFLVPPPSQDASHADAELTLAEFRALAPGISAAVEWGRIGTAPPPGDPRLRARPNVLIFPDPVSGHLAHALLCDTTPTRVWGPLFPGDGWAVAGVGDGAEVEDIVAIAVVAAAGTRDV